MKFTPSALRSRIPILSEKLNIESKTQIDGLFPIKWNGMEWNKIDIDLNMQ